MSESVESLRTRIEDLESEIGDLEDALRRPPEEVKKRRVIVQRDVDGDVDEEVLEELVSRLRRHFSTLGDVELVGRTMSWTLKPNAQAGVMRMLQVTVTPRVTGVRIRLVDDLQLAYNNRVAGYSVGLGMLGFGSVAALAALAGPAVVPVALLAPVVTHQLGKRSFRKLAVEREVEANAVLDELVRAIAEMSSATTPQEKE